MTRILTALPAVRAGREGRTAGIVWRLVIGGAAMALVTLGKETVAVGILGGLVAVTLLFLPLSQLRKRRLLTWAGGLGKPRQVIAPQAGELMWDDEKLTIRSEERVWRSMRPRAHAARVVLCQRNEALMLGLVPPKKKAAQPIWLSAPRAQVTELFEPLGDLGAAPEVDPGETVMLSGADMAQALEALWDAGARALPKARGPARTEKKDRR